MHDYHWLQEGQRVSPSIPSQLQQLRSSEDSRLARPSLPVRFPTVVAVRSWGCCWCSGRLPEGKKSYPKVRAGAAALIPDEETIGVPGTVFWVIFLDG